MTTESIQTFWTVEWMTKNVCFLVFNSTYLASLMWFSVALIDIIDTNTLCNRMLFNIQIIKRIPFVCIHFANGSRWLLWAIEEIGRASWIICLRIAFPFCVFISVDSSDRCIRMVYARFGVRCEHSSNQCLIDQYYIQWQACHALYYNELL